MIVSCTQPPAQEPQTQPEVSEPPAAQEPASSGTMIDYTDLFPTYPKELPAFCDPAKVQAAYVWAKENWSLPVEENEGYIPMIRPAKERYKIGVIQGLVGIPAQARGDVSVQNAADLMCVDLVWCNSKFEAEAAINCAEVDGGAKGGRSYQRELVRPSDGSHGRYHGWHSSNRLGSTNA